MWRQDSSPSPGPATVVVAFVIVTSLIDECWNTALPTWKAVSASAMCPPRNDTAYGVACGPDATGRGVTI